MEIFKLFESTISHVQLDHMSSKDLRRDQILDNYNEATKTLQTLIKAKESEIAYRRDLVEMLEKSKTIHDNKLSQAKQAYQVAKKHAPDSLDLKPLPKIKIEPTQPMDESLTPNIASTIPILSGIYTPAATSTSALPNIAPPPLPFTASIPPPQAFTSSIPPPLPFTSMQQHQPQPMLISLPGLNSNPNSQTSPDLDIPLPNESVESRSSLDRRLSEFFKTYPNLTQTGLANTYNTCKPSRTPERGKYSSSASSSSHSSSKSKRR